MDQRVVVRRVTRSSRKRFQMWVMKTLVMTISEVHWQDDCKWRFSKNHKLQIL